LLQAAVAEAESVLKKYDLFAGTLSETGLAIPKALAEERQLASKLGAAEITGSDDTDELRRRLAEVAARREAAARQRASASEELRGMAGQLTQARDGVGRSQAEFAGTVVAEFHARWNRCCRSLAALYAEAQELGRALRVEVKCPPPYVAGISLMTGGRPEVRFALSVEQTPVTLPPDLIALAAVVDRLEAAIATVGALGQAAEIDARHQALARIQLGLPARMSGTYQAVKPFTHCGTAYTPGMLLDASLMTSGELFRFWKGRAIEPVSAVATHRAA
jgi:hypothetical protein